MNPSIIIIGAGGHGKVVYDAIVAQGVYSIKGFVDSLLPIGTTVIKEAAVISSQSNIENLIGQVDFFIVAIGNNENRADIYNSYKKCFNPATIIHPSAVVSSSAIVSQGSVVLANSVINAFCRVGENSIVNTAVVLDHDCNVGNHVYLRLGTIVANNAIVNDFYCSEIGEIIKPFSK